MPIVKQVRGLDLIYSEEDGGYYWQNDRFQTSKIYKSQLEAEKAEKSTDIDWD